MNSSKTSEIDSLDVVVHPSGEPPVPIEEAVVVPAQEVEQDIILTAVKEEESPDKILNAVMYGLAEEQEALKKLRKHKDEEHKDTSHISLKRGTLLKYMSETVIQRQALVGAGGDVDLRGPKFRQILGMFLDCISDSFDEAKIPNEYKDMFFTTLSRNFEGWENKAEKILKGAGIR